MNPAIKISTWALGDTISAVPTINKLAKTYEQPITVFSSHKDLFKNHPSVLEVKNLNDSTEGYTVHTTMVFDDHKQHNNIDIRQFHAWDIGISLTTDELECDLYCEEDPGINLGEYDYVIIHPSKTWASRTWSQENWQYLADKLRYNGFEVIAIGNDNNQTEWNYDQQKFISKGLHKIEGVIDLTNGSTVPELRWLMKNAFCVVTMDSGPLHIAGTTDCHIVHLGSSINPKLRAPWRNGTQDYKYHYVKGECDLFCASNQKYGIKEWGTIKGVPPLEKCQENYEEFKCHSTPEKVLETILSI